MVELGLGWSQSTVIRLVEEYKKRPELWDIAHESYRKQTTKYEAWSEMAAIFDCDIADLRRKMNSILASLRREKTKVRCGGRSSWFLYDYMHFLPTHIPNNVIGSPDYKRCTKLEAEDDQSDNENNDTIVHEEEEQEVEEEEENEVDEGEEHQLIYIKQEPSTTKFVRPTTKYIHQSVNKPRLIRTRRIRKKPITANSNKLDSKILETLKLIKSSNLTKKKDECDSFGEYIANSLRKHDERTQSMIKQAINNILFEQEMKKYGPGPYEVLMTAEENPLILEDSSK
ncbi:uncharacterized protein LOC128675291 [Plodia interpunctella]|uniref:uncharacterized protein LOC128675291 n=1 Tax=Plodia interpunctella TaxID=58824 RepID=UPI002368F2A5|nr:uncharacterized protein LOC128675291 [Plodia interpunctella]